MPTTFNLQDLLKGDAAQLSSLFDTAALTLPQASGLTLCSDLSHAIALIQPVVNPGESLAKQLPPLLATHQLTLAPALLLRVMVADKLIHTPYNFDATSVHALKFHRKQGRVGIIYCKGHLRSHVLEA